MSLYVLMLPVLKSTSIYEDVFLSDDLVVKTSTSQKFNLDAKGSLEFPFATFPIFSPGRKLFVSSFGTPGVGGRDYLAMPGMPRSPFGGG